MLLEHCRKKSCIIVSSFTMFLLINGLNNSNLQQAKSGRPPIIMKEDTTTITMAKQAI